MNENGYKAEALYFAVFDGHAGTGASLMAANCLHEHIRVSIIFKLLIDYFKMLTEWDDLVYWYNGAERGHTLNTCWFIG